MIDYLLHFYRSGTKPFQSLSVLPDADAVQRMKNLYVEGSIFWERFKDPPLYLRARRQIERWLWEEFRAKGGKPRETCPLYLVLGRPLWTLRVADAATTATTDEIRVPLSLFQECDISFTYPDSMVSTLLAKERNPEYFLPEYHGKVFTLSQIRSIVESKGLPGEGWDARLPPRLANYIEAQVWNHGLLADYLSRLDDDGQRRVGD
jgi:hypothetical protein